MNSEALICDVIRCKVFSFSLPIVVVDFLIVGIVGCMTPLIQCQSP